MIKAAACEGFADAAQENLATSFIRNESFRKGGREHSELRNA